jgi:hypothetical protein
MIFSRRVGSIQTVKNPILTIDDIMMYTCYSAADARRIAPGRQQASLSEILRLDIRLDDLDFLVTTLAYGIRTANRPPNYAPRLDANVALQQVLESLSILLPGESPWSVFLFGPDRRIAFRLADALEAPSEAL